jgi:hypothetical protein
MREENEIGERISRCLKRCKPPVDLYIKESDGDYIKINDGAVADINSATEELEEAIGNYLRLKIKEAEIDNRLIQVKCDAYELALTGSRPAERIREEESCED